MTYISEDRYRFCPVCGKHLTRSQQSEEAAGNALEFGRMDAQRPSCSKNFVLYRNNPAPGEKYCQIAVIEADGQFQVRVFDGDVVQVEPFDHENPDAAYFFHITLADALADADAEFERAKAEGMTPYVPDGPK